MTRIGSIGMRQLPNGNDSEIKTNWVESATKNLI